MNFAEAIDTLPDCKLSEVLHGKNLTQAVILTVEPWGRNSFD